MQTCQLISYGKILTNKIYGAKVLPKRLHLNGVTPEVLIHLSQR